MEVNQKTWGTLSAIYVTAVILLGAIDLYSVQDYTPFLLFGECVKDSGDMLVCSGIRPWLSYLLIAWPLLGVWWLVQLYRWAIGRISIAS